MSNCQHEKVACVACGEPMTAISPPIEKLDARVTPVLYDPWTEWLCVQVCGWSGKNRDDASAHTVETGHETAGETHSSVHLRPSAGDKAAPKPVLFGGKQISPWGAGDKAEAPRTYTQAEHDESERQLRDCFDQLATADDLLRRYPPQQVQGGVGDKVEAPPQDAALTLYPDFTDYDDD